MTLEQASKATIKYAVLATTGVLLFFIILLLIGETRGDFANGILFFLAGLINPITVIYFIILYSFTYFLARRATNDIVIKNRKPWQLSLSIAIIISIVTSSYFTAWTVIKMTDSKLDLSLLKLAQPALKLFFTTTFFEFIIWTWVTTRTKQLPVDTYELDDYR